MKSLHRILALPLLAATLALLGCGDLETPTEPAGQQVAMARGGGGGGGGGRPGGEAAGNNLSYPVIWAEGVMKTVPGTAGMEPVLQGSWWYQWGTNGTDPDVTPASCAPDPDEGDAGLNPGGLPLCDDRVPGSVDLSRVAGTPAADTPLPLARAYLQKDPASLWQAGSWPAAGARPSAEVVVDRVDWGDNLESVDWYTRSKVRTEVVLFEDAWAGDAEEHGWPMLEYEMRHTSGWGIDEVHGLAATLAGEALPGPGTRATVYSGCARFTIQKLLVDRNDPRLSDLTWVPREGWTEAEGVEDDLVAPHLFNGSVHEGGDGPGYYSAEINVKGRIIYGYTWNVRTLNEGAGDYRLTFSFDDVCGATPRNTAFADGVTEILLPVEEVVVTESESEEGGGTAVLRPELNLTYIDVRILQRGGGGGGR